MAYKAKTLRRMTPDTRKLARLINELDSTLTRLKNLLPGFRRGRTSINILIAGNLLRRRYKNG